MTNEFSKTEPIYIHYRITNNNEIQVFRLKLHEADWREIETSRNPDVCYEIFSKKLMSLLDECVPIKVIKLKTKGIKTPWIIAGKKKSSKHKQPLYEKVLKCIYKKAENGKHSII